MDCVSAGRVKQRVLVLACLQSLCTALVTVQPPVVNYRPIVGVLAQRSETPDLPGDTYISATYVKFLEAAGARVVPILVGQPHSYYESVFAKINGVLFPGGTVDLVTSLFARASHILLDQAVMANDRGDYFPLWGTCQGFQVMVCDVANANVLNHTDSYNMALPLELMPDYQKSRLFGNAPENIMHYLRNENVTENFHHDSVLVEEFFHNQRLSNFFHVLSVNKDRQGVAFLSTYEAFQYPFYATQWHPEVVVFQWSTHFDQNHSPHAIAVSQYIADFFVMEARRNKHRFPSAEEEAHAVIENYNMVYSDDGSYTQRYYFNLTLHHH